MTTTTKPRCKKVRKPAELKSCSCLTRPAYRCTLLPKGLAGVVEINGTGYHLLPLGADPQGGYRLVNVGSGAVYDIDTSAGWPLCDCPSQLFNQDLDQQQFCKHSLGLIELRRQGAI